MMSPEEVKTGGKIIKKLSCFVVFTAGQRETENQSGVGVETELRFVSDSGRKRLPMGIQ